MRNWLRKRWKEIESELGHSPRRGYLTPALYAQYQVVLPLICQHVHGELIDLGCGDMPFRDTIVNQVTVYHSLDLWPRSDDVTYIDDISDMSTVLTASYDSAICIEVLEHVPDPFSAIREIYRILKPGGIFVISVPHLSRLHDEPYDFFRFTIYGLRNLLENAGFEVLEIQKRGSLFSFLGHQVSTVLLSVAWPLPGLRQIAWFLNKWCITRLCYSMDHLLDRAGVFALGYVGVSRKLSTGDTPVGAEGR